MTDAPVLFVDLSCNNIAHLGPHRLAGPDTRNIEMASLNALRKLGAPLNAAITFRPARPHGSFGSSRPWSEALRSHRRARAQHERPQEPGSADRRDRDHHHRQPHMGRSAQHVQPTHRSRNGARPPREETTAPNVINSQRKLEAMSTVNMIGPGVLRISVPDSSGSYAANYGFVAGRAPSAPAVAQVTYPDVVYTPDENGVFAIDAANVAAAIAAGLALQR
jgi:hypothetical protein